MMQMVNQAGLDLIKRFEGCRLKAYLCPAGIPTIGYGHTAGVSLGMVWTQDQAEEALIKDAELVSKSVSNILIAYRIAHPETVVTANQFAALVSFAFNVRDGINILISIFQRFGLVGFSERVCLYCHSNGKVLKGLLDRRMAERELFFEPDNQKYFTSSICVEG